MKTTLQLSLLVLFFSLLHQERPSAQTYSNVTSQMGINFIQFNAWGGGVSFVDFNNDGFDDLSIVGSIGQVTGIYRNDVSSFSQVSYPNIRTSWVGMTVLWADYDRDNNSDLFVTGFRSGAKLYHNNGNGTFTDVTASAGLLNDTSLSFTAACWGDINNDGLLDLYVGYYNDTQIPRRSYLYKNNGTGTFTDITNQAQVGDSLGMPLAIQFFDYNNDGWQDLYIAEDKRRGNVLYKNNGNGTFDDVSIPSGTNYICDGMGIAVADYNRDGWLDFYVTNSELGNGLFRNNGNGTFTNVALQMGVGVYKHCWGVSFLDYNNDGNPDIYVCVSHGVPARRNVLFRNNGNNTFTQMSGIGLDGDNYASYGCSIGDFDNNGYPDIAEANIGDPFCLWKNSGGSNSWIKLKLHGIYSNKEGIGSRIEVYLGGSRLLREVNCGTSYCSQNTFTQLIGVGNISTLDSILVKWPSGARNSLYNTGVNQLIHVFENPPIGIRSNNQNVPKELTLYQNYPNPFNPATVIRFSVAKLGYTTIKVCDLSGKEVVSLVNEVLNPGTYEVNWDAQNFSSGIYFCTLSNNGFIKTNKMLLIK